jgi:hypothetical protein
MFEFPLYLARQVGIIRDYGSFRLGGQLAVKLLSVPTVRISLSPLAETLGVMAVEAKAGETFGELVSVWNTTPGKSARLAWACDLLGVDLNASDNLCWQLFHRAASSVLEAKRYHAPNAVMLVHDFSEQPSWVEDFLSFADAIGIHGAGVGHISEPKAVDGVELRLAWVHQPLTS